MYFVSWGAVRRRTTQAALLTLLAALAAAAATAGVWYGLTVASRAAGAEVAARPAAQRVVTVHQQINSAGDPRASLDALAATTRGLLPLPGVTPILGVAHETLYTDRLHGYAPSGMPVAYRDGLCEHARITGACPSTPDTVVISADASRRIGVKTGDTIEVRPEGAGGVLRLRVSGVYAITGADEQYWTDPLFRAQGDLDPLFTTLDTFREPSLGRPTLAVAVPVPLPLLRGDHNYDLNGVLNEAGPRFAAAQLELDNPTGELFDAVLADRRTVIIGVLAALAQVLVLAWFALGLAGRLTGRDRRADAGLLKLRGATGGGLLRLAAGQHLVPLVVGAVAGLPIGIVASRLVAGELPVRSEWWLALLLAAGAILVVELIGLLVLVGVDGFAQRAPVVALLQRVSGARRDWRSRFVDVFFVALAAGAVYQARTGGPDSGLGVAAPGLVALAVGLLLARFLRWVADRIGGAAVRAGRLRLGLTAVQVSRQPGTDRVFALLVVAVALLALTTGGLAAGRTERAARSDVELGAARVLTVKAQSRTALEYAVRRADPGGKQAMAVVVDTTAAPPVLAVDSARLAAVARWRPEYGPVGALAAAVAAVHLPPSAPLITGRTLAVTLDRGAGGPELLGAILQHEGTGDGFRVEFHGLRTGTQTVTADVTRCAVAPGCRLVGWQLFPAAGGLTIRSVGQQSPAAVLLDATALADVGRWRAGFTGVVARIASTGGLALGADGTSGTEVYAVDAPLPVPIVLAGTRPDQWRFDDAMSGRFGGTTTPVRLAATASVLPVLGRDGILTDLDTARRVAGDADLGGTFQVWLADGVPASLIDALRDNGLAVLADRTAAARTTALATEGRVITSSFGLFAAGLALLVAAAMIGIVAAAERAPQLAMLRALRVQGLDTGRALIAGYAGAAALVLAGVAGGVLAALVARPAAAVTAPAFPDGWRVIPPPGVVDGPVLAAAAGIGLAVFGIAGWLSVRGLRGGAR
ncbi:FtsX-like permease family protein [Actinoplanes sp. NPDC026619]|uniref:FtsX-like permease family protein n=1 Tax=Actinoplanes sp. NPDC026619 TaxID=3155798 RepID=UPI0033FBCA27